jgi:methyl-accepting chemotaxis protein
MAHRKMKKLMLPSILFSSVITQRGQLMLTLLFVAFIFSSIGYLYFDLLDVSIAPVHQPNASVISPSETVLDVNQYKMYAAISLLIAFLLMSYFSYGRYLHHKESLSRLKKQCRAIADGDFSPREKCFHNDDDFTSMHRDLERVSTEFQRLLYSVTEMATEVSGASSEIEKISEKESLHSSRQTNAVSAIAAAIHENTENTSHISEKSDIAAMVSEKSKKQAEEGVCVVNDAIIAIQAVSETVSSTSTKAEKLTESSAKINSIVNVIQEIANQTNLLALNAAIEAARAGEQGRGFAVVADEVRNLATKTHDATSEISVMIESVQQGISAIIQSIQEIDGLVIDGVSLANKAGENLNYIQDNVSDTLDIVKQISQSVNEQGHSTQEISESVKVINIMVEENEKNINDAASTISYLKVISDNLSNELPHAELEQE